MKRLDQKRLKHLIVAVLGCVRAKMFCEMWCLAFLAFLNVVTLIY